MNMLSECHSPPISATSDHLMLQTTHRPPQHAMNNSPWRIPMFAAQPTRILQTLEERTAAPENRCNCEIYLVS
ncbi:hypothetical protein T265_04940 [Opisthorchis viverrini]|uniref:Uncharacterized protein n=1 Tax=Opisthorchis viverrini TaxID=6198 RepID=A0A075AFY4_OPIVI|nr:hypothetical protein T265_04940 [Opisthorchis viverrini]KER28184.1 hypothetical protein T265_04940 [Opisthorchis viverrini]